MFQAYYQKYKQEFTETLERLDYTVIEQILTTLERARQEGRQVFVIGNGGSAASASHWACDFGKGINTEASKRMRVFSLTDNLPWFSALGNDLSYGDVFAEPLKNYMNEGDILIGLSVSGNSENVVKAFQLARAHGCTVIALVGAKRGRMAEESTISLTIPSEDYGIVEDVHMFVNHVISQHMKQINEQGGTTNE
jgi:D-sedoheptulose 7-phosphate isomerase